MFKPALIFIYNHLHPENIEPLERIYHKRFPDTYHLIPFYDGKKINNVIPVCDNSFYFHSFIPQGFNDYYSDEYTHYIFTADDFLLNPYINSENFIEYFGLSSQPDDACFSPLPFVDIGNAFGYHKLRTWAYNYYPQIPGFKNHQELPTFEEALERIKELGFDTKYFKELKYDTPSSKFYDKNDIYYAVASYHQAIQYINKPYKLSNFNGFKNHLSEALLYWIIWQYRKFINKRKPYTMNYPLICGNSDMFVIPAKHIRTFSKFCAIFAASNLYVEIAMPTALALLKSPIIHGTLSPINKIEDIHNELSQTNNALLGITNNMDKSLPELYNYKLNNFLHDFPSAYGIHPLKLSQWDTALSKSMLKTLGY